MEKLNHNHIQQNYQEIIHIAEQKLIRVKQNIHHIGTLRLILFIAGVAGIYNFWNLADLLVFSTVLTGVPFLLLLKYHNQLSHKKEYLEKKIEITQEELQAMKGDTSAFGNGEVFIDSTHLYSYDLDVFGTHSLFQCVNRTSTELGMKKLASWLNTHLENKKEIEKRQSGVQELTSELQLRQRFRILGLLYKGNPADEEEIKNWANTKSYYHNRLIIRILPAIVFIINISLIGLALAGVISSSIASIAFAAFVTCSFIFSRNISKKQSIYGKKLQILATYAKLIQLIEQKEMKSDVLKEIKNQIVGSRKTASEAVQTLTTRMNALDQRNNIMVAIVLNGLFFWELRQFMKIEAWKENHASELPRWLNAIGEMDAYCSLATFAYNHPEYIYPEITSHPFSMQAKAMGHPLMNQEKCVRNDIHMEKQPHFIIITGANMAGKSTYLRTVGINYLLACVGMPVWADQMSLYPARLITSLRTSDSLTDNESYFFAELKRLKLIIDRLNSGEKLFIILDEILKGTNSMDKQKGSFALIKQFMTLRANGIIATHDLLLGKLADTFPKDIQNYRFEADITNNELTFSYQMREGIAQNMNACFLMKKMGIAVIND